MNMLDILVINVSSKQQRHGTLKDIQQQYMRGLDIIVISVSSNQQQRIILELSLIHI